MQTMKAIVQDRYGSPGVLRFTDTPVPVPAEGEVLVRVRAASVNAYDWHVLRGDPYLARLSFGLPRPKVRIPGRDIAGVVESAGAGVTQFQPGDEVFGDVGMAGGAFAEYVRTPASRVVAKPAGLTFAEAAAIPLAGNTALICLREAAQIQAGQRVLINGASGGVGTFAIQLAKAFGASVTAVCSTRNAAQARTLGADRVIDYTRADFTRDASRYDIVVDLAGNRSLTDCRRALRPAGTLVLSGGGNSNGGNVFGPLALFLRAQVVARFARHRILMPSTFLSTENLVTLGELAEAKQVRPVIDRTYPLNETPQAIDYLEREHARAKIVITM
jgi:NADPH:quinone reductase-like Zn-dependent oxidoreductase